LLGKLNNIGRQTLLVLTTARDLALRRAVLPKRRTGPTLGDMQMTWLSMTTTSNSIQKRDGGRYCSSLVEKGLS
jgi:hypothetical protein